MYINIKKYFIMLRFGYTKFFFFFFFGRWVGFGYPYHIFIDGGKNERKFSNVKKNLNNF
jgi:hypothetical protein